MAIIGHLYTIVFPWWRWLLLALYSVVEVTDTVYSNVLTVEVVITGTAYRSVPRMEVFITGTIYSSDPTVEVAIIGHL